MAPQRGGVTDAHAQPVIGQRRLEVRLARHLVARHALQLSILVGYNNVVEVVHLDVLRLTTSGEAQHTCEQITKLHSPHSSLHATAMIADVWQERSL